MLKYSYVKQLNIPFNEAIAKTIAAFKAQSFGVLTDIDVKVTLKEKLDVDLKTTASWEYATRHGLTKHCRPKLKSVCSCLAMSLSMKKTAV